MSSTFCKAILVLMNDVNKINKIKQWLGSGSIDIFGRPFAGKDSQCLELAKVFGGKVISGGDILRSSKETSKLLKNNIDNGKMAPSNEYLEIVTNYFNKKELFGTPLMLSSVGRWHGEEYPIMQALEKSNHPLKLAIYLNISNEESYRRWMMLKDFNDRPNRADDTKEILKIRNQQFNEKTLPVIQYYRQLNMLVEVDGNKSRHEVTKDIIEYIYQKIS